MFLLNMRMNRQSKIVPFLFRFADFFLLLVVAGVLLSLLLLGPLLCLADVAQHLVVGLRHHLCYRFKPEGSQ